MGSLQKSVEHNSEIREVLKKWVSVFDQTKRVFEISEGKDFLWLSFNSVCSLDHTKKGFLGYMQNQMKNVFGLNFNLGKIRKRLKKLRTL